ncbi:MAG TPA: hypothetical protein VHP83_20475 [Aggregatilineaceae bacterium]|nr:hypothetical protein [Aggregatilineaceae bacterium]
MSKNRLQIQKQLPMPTEDGQKVLDVLPLVYNAGIQVGNKQGYQLGIEHASEQIMARIKPVNDSFNRLLAVVVGAARAVDFLRLRTAGIREAARILLREDARAIYDQYLELEKIMIDATGASIQEIDPVLYDELIAFHNAITEFVIGRDATGEQLMQTPLMTGKFADKLSETLSEITIGGRAKDAVSEYLGEQLQKLMDVGMKQQDAATELRDRLKAERQLIPDHRLEFPKSQALDILLEPYAGNNNRFKQMRKRYRDNQF